MDATGLTTEEIRRVVAMYVPERLDAFNDLTGIPLPQPGATPMEWTDGMRMELFLFLWGAYDPSRPI